MTLPLALITRPRADAEALAEAVRALGAEPLLAPMLEIENLPGDAPDVAGVQAILLTSANGARALAARLSAGHAAYDLPVFAVGDATARVARECGLMVPEVAGGDVDALAKAVGEALEPATGRLLHVAGRDVAGDLSGRLGEAGFTVERAVLYEARAAGALSPAVLRALEGRAVAFALFFSPRTTGTFVTLCQAAGLSGSLDASAAICLSEAVAAAAREIPWGRVAVATQPTQAALLEALVTEVARRAQPVADE